MSEQLIDSMRCDNIRKAKHCFALFVVKGNQNMVIINSHRVYNAVNELPSFVRLAHIQFTKTANSECHIRLRLRDNEGNTSGGDDIIVFLDSEQVGRDHCLALNVGCTSLEEFNNLDGIETTLRLTDSGHGVVTPYGVVLEELILILKTGIC